ncbi:recombinase family protein [Mesorhizobium sp. VK24D]|uniref:Recombinase family protein n=1 Tax=Mesorhizobium album TaxID=3072314 RepID=A0ABU4XZT6_9HYPH|nr:recombinase family protein [Mesorhizobium sp. VK24D]MDX8480123.1 recombinase family protein [Mesorhizobium sp. VK24D]
MSLRKVCRQLEQIGCQTRTGATHWHAFTIRGMLANAAYVGCAAFRCLRYLLSQPRLRPIRGIRSPRRGPLAAFSFLLKSGSRSHCATCDRTVFEAARAQLEENRKRKRQRAPSADWLLQGLTVCRRGGYAYYGKRAPRSRKYDPANTLRYYRRIGADGYRFSDHAVYDNPPVRGDHLD